MTLLATGKRASELAGGERQSARDERSRQPEQERQPGEPAAPTALRYLHAAGNHATQALLAGGPLQRRTQCQCAACAAGGKPCPKCSAERRDNEPESVLARLGPGRPFAGGPRQRMESALGRSFDGVRLHAGARGARVASEVGAPAYAVGNHIGFAAGAYRPGTPAGDAMLAHELAHTAQQRSAVATAAGGERATEADADRSAGSALLRLRGNRQAAAGPRLTGGLRLARCRPNESDFTDEQLTQYVDTLRKQKAPVGDDGDIMARAVIHRHFKGNATFSVVDVPIRILLIKEMLLGFTNDDDEDAILQLLRDSPTSERQVILKEVGIAALRDNFHGDQSDQLEELLQEHDMDHDISVLAGWTAASVMPILNRHGDQRLLQHVVDNGWKIHKFSKAWTEWELPDGSTQVEEARINGNTCKSVRAGCTEAKVIRVKASLTTEKAAATLAHEIEHAMRPEASTRPAQQQEEIDVRVANEEFRMRRGMPPKRADYRNPDGSINVTEIENDIRQPGGHYNPTGRDRIDRWYDDDVEVTGWSVP